MEIIDLEIMDQEQIVEAVGEAVQDASRGKTAMFDWLCVRAYANFPDFTDSEKVLQKALEQVRNSVTG